MMMSILPTDSVFEVCGFFAVIDAIKLSIGCLHRDDVNITNR